MKFTLLPALTRWIFSCFLVGVARLELAASWSRTKHATKLRYTPRQDCIPAADPQRCNQNNGCPTRIRTQTNRVRVCRATFTQSGNVTFIIIPFFTRLSIAFQKFFFLSTIPFCNILLYNEKHKFRIFYQRRIFNGNCSF